MSDRVITLDNSSLLGLLKNATILAKFPALRHMAKRLKVQARGCGKCGRRKAKATAGITNDMKQAISNWPVSNKQTLKKMLGVDKIKLVVGKKVTEF